MQLIQHFETGIICKRLEFCHWFQSLTSWHFIIYEDAIYLQRNEQYTETAIYGHENPLLRVVHNC
jgi:hypothetical protein